MYLKKIEVQGFKSFANKIVFDFHEGITGIVGPNGSGKSNVSDAVRWVLGEQSAKSLRGGNMQDVIFAGTKLRKPQGYAFVAITLDNSDRSLAIDFNEVTVSRRLFRSGESEYMINGSAVRLKDVNELFYDTGIGKDGYSIIGQGEVEKILSGRPEERRELFDEAVGITKFKRRKNIAIKKLDSEKANLTRVSDILSELEKQLSPLKKQSELAKRYLKLRDELKILDANMYILQEDTISKELLSIKENVEILQGSLKEVQVESEGINKSFESIDNELSLLEEKINKDREALSHKNIQIKEMQGKIDVLKEQINTDTVNLEHFSNRKQSIKTDIELKRKNIDKEEEEKNSLLILSDDISAQKKELEADIRAFEEEIAKAGLKLAGLNEIKLSGLSSKAELNTGLESSKTVFTQLNIRQSELDKRLISIRSEDKSIENRIEEDKLKLEALYKELESLNLELSLIEEENKKAHIDEEKLLKDIDITKNLYQQEKAKLNSLKNIAERYDGYSISIKKVMESKAELKGIHGVVADLIGVEKKYELAVETALGGRIQNIVIDTEETAKILIEYLKKNKFGRATFLPLSSVEAGTEIKNKAVFNEKGVLGIASDLVNSDKQYEKLIKNLLAKTIVVDNIDNAIYIARKYKYEHRLVTLDGEQFLPGGSLSGGAYKNSSNLLGRKREIELIENKVSEYEEKLKTGEATLISLKEKIKSNSVSLLTKKDVVSSLSVNINTIQNSIDIYDERKNKSISDINILIEQKDKLSLQISEEKKRIAAFEKEISNKNIEILNADDEILSASKELDKIKLENEKLQARLRETELKLTSSRADAEHRESNIGRIKLELEELIRQDDLLDSNTDFSASIEEKNRQIEEIRTNIEDLKKTLSTDEDILKNDILSRDSKSNKHKELFEKKDEIMNRITLLEKDIFRLENNEEKLQDRLASIGNYMWNEYELSLNSCKELKNDDLSNMGELKKNIDRLKNEIRSIGNVNIAAIEEYSEVSTRYEELKTQYDDITLASGQLVSIINELDAGMRKQFKEKFALIDKEFNKVFSELFAGGSGKLELEEGEDILEAGISIISQPPGKKLQNMMQLSGGEKALTAISLLFAIQNLKPSPFALLDEIEAALDDSNVDRFAHYLHKLSDRTQFIVITHRRGTMLNSDRLYGITMQEKGVSTLVSVNLIESELDN